MTIFWLIGPTGCGKSTLGAKLSQKFNAPILEEPWKNNWHIKNLDSNLYAANYLQLQFMRAHHERGSEIAKTSAVILDRTLLETARIFVLEAAGLISKASFNLLIEEAEKQTQYILENYAPNLVFFMRRDAKTILAQIKRRNRAFEQTDEEAMLERINNQIELYDAFFNYLVEQNLNIMFV